MTFASDNARILQALSLVGTISNVKKMYCKLAVMMKEKDTRLTQRELSRQTGLSVTTINRLHNNEFDRVDAATINTLCNFFDCEVGELFVMKEMEEVA